MKRLLMLIVIIALFAIPVSAVDFTAPEAPDSAQVYMPPDTESFGEGLWYVFKTALAELQPRFAEASGICLSLIAVVLLASILKSFLGSSKQTVELVATLAIGTLLFQSSNTLVRMGTQTVEELSQYGKLILPVMTAAMAAQGGVTTSAALYAGTAAFDAVLGAVISRLITPMVYIYLCLCVANRAIGEELLDNLRSFVKWAMTWCLKIVLYIFTGYIGITGVVSGATDAAALKAMRLTITGFVPVVGGIISDASEAILVGAGVVKSAVGVYGLITLLAIWIGPFMRIGVQYLLLKVTAGVCGVFGTKQASGLVQDFSAAMGFLLAMTGAMCLLLLISTVCFMKGVA